MELKEKLGPLFVVSRRFGLKQTDKTRPIDDLSQSLVNAAFASSYKLDLSGIDGFAVLARTMLECVNESGVVSMQLGDGELLEGHLHPTIAFAQSRELRGRTLDLDAAYKQMLVCKSSLWAAVWPSKMRKATIGFSCRGCFPSVPRRQCTPSTGCAVPFIALESVYLV